MTEQPSAEALKLASRYADGEVKKCAADIDALCEQRVSAETIRWQNRDRQRLEQIDRLQATVQSLQSARAERDAAAFLAFGRRVWSDTEEVAYQAGVSDTR